jgi:hypothetical protein
MTICVNFSGLPHPKKGYLDWGVKITRAVDFLDIISEEESDCTVH